MADFDADFRPIVGVYMPAADPVDFGAVFAPLLEVGDLAPPVVTKVAPAGSTLRRTDPAVFDIVDTIELRRITVWIEYTSGDCELVYARSQFCARFRRSSLVDITPGLSARLTLVRESGWPAGNLRLQIEAADGRGNFA